MKQRNLRTREVNSNLRCFCDRRLLTPFLCICWESCAEDFDIALKLCLAAWLSLASLIACLLCWTLVLHSRCFGSHTCQLPMGKYHLHRNWASAAPFTALKHHLASTASCLCCLWVFFPPFFLFVHSFWWPSLGQDKLSHCRDRNLGDSQFCLQWVPRFYDSSHSSENSVLAVAMNLILLLHAGLEKLHQCSIWGSPGQDRGRLEWKATKTVRETFPFF